MGKFDTLQVVIATDENGNPTQFAEARLYIPENKQDQKLNKEIESLDFNGEKISYIKPGIAQTPFMLQWMIEGFLQSIPEEEKEKEFKYDTNSSSNPEKTIAYLERLLEKESKPLESATTSEKFQYVIEKINFISESEDYSFEEIIGAAMIGTEASIKYLYPVFKQCFPELNPYRIKDEVFNFCMGTMINQFFSDLVARIQN